MKCSKIRTPLQTRRRSGDQGLETRYVQAPSVGRRPESALSLFQVAPRPVFRPGARPRSAGAVPVAQRSRVSSAQVTCVGASCAGRPVLVQRSQIAQDAVDLDGAAKYYERRPWLVRRDGELRVEDL